MKESTWSGFTSSVFTDKIIYLTFRFTWECAQELPAIEHDASPNCLVVGGGMTLNDMGCQLASNWTLRQPSINKCGSCTITIPEGFC